MNTIKEIDRDDATIRYG